MNSDWDTFLARAAERSPEGKLLGIVWTAVTAQLATEGLKLPTPRASFNDDIRGETAAFMSWEAGEHYVDVDIENGGSLAWFYKNRKTDVYEGSEESVPCAPLPEDMMGFLRLVAGAHMRSDSRG